MIYGIRTGYFDVVAHPDRIFRRCREWTEGCNHIAREIGVSAARQAMQFAVLHISGKSSKKA